MARGDHIKATRDLGHHHDGIDLGDGWVIHFAADPGDLKTFASIRKDSWETFAGGGTISTRPYGGNPDPEQTVARAESRLGETGYDLIVNNCEHFALWCVTGDHHSEQIWAVASFGGVVGSTAVGAALGVDVIASVGAVAGMSGAGIMSGLATTGAAVGGGAVAGLVTLGAVPATASVVIVNRALRDDENLPDHERDARASGRVGSLAGAGIGAVGSIGAVSALGAVSGLSAAGISSGLATVGAGVGGGMGAGAVLVIGAPAAAAALVGYGVYRLARWLQNP